MVYPLVRDYVIYVKLSRIEETEKKNTNFELICIIGSSDLCITFPWWMDKTWMANASWWVNSFLNGNKNISEWVVLRIHGEKTSHMGWRLTGGGWFRTTHPHLTHRYHRRKGLCDKYSYDKNLLGVVLCEGCKEILRKCVNSWKVVHLVGTSAWSTENDLGSLKNEKKIVQFLSPIFTMQIVSYPRSSPPPPGTKLSFICQKFTPPPLKRSWRQGCGPLPPFDIPNIPGWPEQLPPNSRKIQVILPFCGQNKPYWPILYFSLPLKKI